MSSDIRLYNTKTKSVEDFEPIKVDHVGIYSCGPTVYHYAHIGNLRAYVFADVLRRMFVSAHYDVKHIINITDVGHMVGDGDNGEDKLEKGAKREGKSVWEVAEFYTEAFMKDIEAIGIPKKDYIFPRATDHIAEQINLIRTLIDKGHAYTISDGIYFDTSTFSSYADFAHLDIEGLKSGARVEENKEKKNITDFALWKFSPKNETRQMEWESPWGRGFPGWHVECSAMSMKYLGNHFDIHTGGIDHIPVHHTNEIAQSEGSTGETYANYWMHVNFLNDTTGKMSKSHDDFLTLESLIKKGYDPLAYRYFLLTAHYRKEIMFSFEALDASAVAYKKLWDWCAEHATTNGEVDKGYKKAFIEALYDDLGTPVCIAQIWALIKDEVMSDDNKYRTLMDMSAILGLGLHLAVKEEFSISEELQELLDERNFARAEKNFIESDRLRDEIQKLGFIVKDTDKGQEVSKI
ncbi:MAG: cysteine--tRNA ligase [Candidatus Paceibacterota bacterium]